MNFQLEMTQSVYMELEYDALLEKAWRHDLTDYHPHFANLTQAVDSGGAHVAGCFVTQSCESAE